MSALEKMADFFAARIDGYDEHMLNDVEGCRNGYIKMAQLVPSDTRKLLDLGCGTGLELSEIFSALPDVKVTGIDLCGEMLDRLKSKFPDKSITLINGDYFSVPFGEGRFDCAVSFQTMHHFPKEKKSELYRKIYKSLKNGGVYIECDYMVESQAQEDLYFSENDRLRKENGIPDSVLCHYDTPCTVSNQIKLFLDSGFLRAERTFREENTTIIVAYKGD